MRSESNYIDIFEKSITCVPPFLPSAALPSAAVLPSAARRPVPADLHLHASTFIYIYLHSSAFIYIYLHLSTFIYISMHLSTFIYNHLHLSTYMYIYLHFQKCSFLCEFFTKKTTPRSLQEVKVYIARWMQLRVCSIHLARFKR